MRFTGNIKIPLMDTLDFEIFLEPSVDSRGIIKSFPQTIPFKFGEVRDTAPGDVPAAGRGGQVVGQEPQPQMGDT